MNKKLIQTLTIITGGFVLLLIIIFGISSCTNKKHTFSQLEDKMIKIAKDHFENNEENLPKIDNKKTLTLDDMISSGKIKSVESYLKDKTVTCQGGITVYNNNGNYLYTPQLNCGKDYKTVSLKEKIIEDNLTETGVGLYKINDEYIMKGEVNKNYIKFNNRLYRIIRINNDGSIRIIDTAKISQTFWDNRYNQEFNFNYGINEYILNNINSRIKDTLEEYYKNESLWSTNSKAYIKTQDLCVGKRLDQDTSKDGSTECSKKVTNQQFGLLATYEYLQASLDRNCSNTTATECSNYNWLEQLDGTWTITANPENSSEVYALGGTLYSSKASNYKNVNIVFNLIGDAIYSSGDGTEDNPYIIK